MPRLLPLLLVAAATGPARAADDFAPLFNGKDLTGWVNVNCAPGTFFAKNNEIVTTGSPTGFLRTAKPYENFVLEFEWMHVEPTKMANSGLFVWGDPIPAVGTGYTRGIEVQVLINFETDWATSDGDIFSIWGAHCTPDRPHPKGYERCLPSEKRVKGAGQWNHYTVTAHDGAIKLAVNGKEVSGVSKCNPRKGYLALESEGAECHFRNLTIKELPSTNPKPEVCAKVDEGYVSLFDGLTLTGWKTEKDAWTAHDGVLKAKGTADLTTEKGFGPGTLMFDYKVMPGRQPAPVVRMGRAANPPSATPVNDAKPGQWQRMLIRTDGSGPIGWTKTYDGLEIMNVFFAPRKEK